MAHSQERLAQYVQIHANLIKHANSLSQNLAVNDGQISQRVYALSRLIDRALLLEAFLNEQIPNELPPNRMQFVDESGEAWLFEAGPLGPTLVEDAAQSMTNPFGALAGSADEDAVDLADILEARRQARNGDLPTDHAAKLDTAPFNDRFGEIS